MDPDELLDEVRDAYTGAEEAVHGPAIVSALWDLARGFRALDDWLSEGGNLPADWEGGPTFADVFGEGGTPL